MFIHTAISNALLSACRTFIQIYDESLLFHVTFYEVTTYSTVLSVLLVHRKDGYKEQGEWVAKSRIICSTALKTDIDETFTIFI